MLSCSVYVTDGYALCDICTWDRGANNLILTLFEHIEEIKISLNIDMRQRILNEYYGLQKYILNKYISDTIVGDLPVVRSTT